MTFHEEMVALSISLLDEFGGPAQLIRSTATFNKATGREVDATPTTTPVIAQIAPVSAEDADGRAVTLSVATLLVEPRRGDKLVVGTRTFVVGDVDTQIAQNLPVVYKAEVA